MKINDFAFAVCAVALLASPIRVEAFSGDDPKVYALFKERIELLREKPRLPDMVHHDMDTIASYVKNKFKFVDGDNVTGQNHWQSAEETIKTGRGDCEDFAVLTYHMLSDNGFNPKIAVGLLTGNDIQAGQFHAVVIVDGKFVIDSRYEDVFKIEDYFKRFQVLYTFDDVSVYFPEQK